MYMITTGLENTLELNVLAYMTILTSFLRARHSFAP